MLLHTLALAVILLLVQVEDTAGTIAPCQVDCRHYGSALGNLADDPFHCNMYYVCFDWFTYSTIPFTCPDGQMFDTYSKTCMKEGYKCSGPCQRCSYDCINNPILGQAADFYSCSTYRQCSGGSGTVISCPSDNPYFDGNICQNDYTKCCSCRPECSQEDVQVHSMVPDLSNCTNFYLCAAPGIPDETSHGHCPNGNFDQFEKNCNSNAPCIVRCSNEPPDNGCVTKWICKEEGYFPKCTASCDPTYFWCTASDIGQEAKPQECTHHFVLDPISMICVPPENCPV